MANERHDLHVLGLDIGGANLKAATDAAECQSTPYELWKRPALLGGRLALLARMSPRCSAWAVTMTGEMADVFPDRAAGVEAIVNHTLAAAEMNSVGDVKFYSIPGKFVSAEQAVADPDGVASANWHATASWLSASIDAPSLMIDIGSTTCDIIPILPGKVATKAKSDFDRLAAGQLVYVGGERTPVCSLVSELPWQGRTIPITREVFATVDDCLLVLGRVAESPKDRATADGAPRTAEAAANRLGRMLGLDRRRVDVAAARPLASAVLAAAIELVRAGIASQPPEFIGRWIVGGHAAEWFLPEIAGDLGADVNSLEDRLGGEASRAAPALACAKMRSEELRGQRTTK